MSGCRFRKNMPVAVSAAMVLTMLIGCAAGAVRAKYRGDLDTLDRSISRAKFEADTELARLDSIISESLLTNKSLDNKSAKCLSEKDCATFDPNLFIAALEKAFGAEAVKKASLDCHLICKTPRQFEYQVRKQYIAERKTKVESELQEFLAQKETERQALERRFEIDLRRAEMQDRASAAALSAAAREMNESMQRQNHGRDTDTMASDSCRSDFDCGYGNACVKPYAGTSGFCARRVNEVGVPTLEGPRLDSLGPRTDPGCVSSGECPIGYSCINNSCVK